MSFYGHAFLDLRFAQYDGCDGLLRCLGRCTWPPDEKFTTVCGVRVLFFKWMELLLISFVSWRWIPDNVSVSLVRVPPVGQTQVYHHVILSLQKSTFVFFHQFFFSPLLRLPTLPPSKNCSSALLLGYFYSAPHSRLVLMLAVLNCSIQLCSKDMHSYIGEKQSFDVLSEHDTDWCWCHKVHWGRHGYYGVHGGWE